MRVSERGKKGTRKREEDALMEMIIGSLFDPRRETAETISVKTVKSVEKMLKFRKNL